MMFGVQMMNFMAHAYSSMISLAGLDDINNSIPLHNSQADSKNRRPIPITWRPRAHGLRTHIQPRGPLSQTSRSQPKSPQQSNSTPQKPFRGFS
eukprot:1143893-Pelagomonas_calceolata.AAC.25